MLDCGVAKTLLDDSRDLNRIAARIAFIDPSATGNVLIELAELPAAGQGADT